MAKTTKRLERVIKRARLRVKKMKPLTKAQIAARVRQALRPYYNVDCFYTGGMSEVTDRRLGRIAGKASVSSGMWLTTGLRDISFDFRTLTRATDAAARIKAAKVRGPDKRPVRVLLRAFWKA